MENDKYAEFSEGLRRYAELYERGLKKQANTYIADFVQNFEKSGTEAEREALLFRFCRNICDGGKSAEQIASILDVPVPSVGGSVPFIISAPSTFSALSAASVPSATSTSSDSTASSTSGVSSRTVTFYRMPSSSRAYPLSLEKKAAAYARIFGL